MPKPREQTSRGAPRPGGAAQADEAAGEAAAVVAQSILMENAEETITAQRDHMLYGALGDTPLHPNEAFDGRA